MSKKRVYYGWIGKCETPEDVYQTYLEAEGFPKNRGKKSNWGDDFWPPKRVRITVEEV